jgi:hypothetical protein
VRWTSALYDGFQDERILRCPSDLSRGATFGGPNPIDRAPPVGPIPALPCGERDEDVNLVGRQSRKRQANFPVL